MTQHDYLKERTEQHKIKNILSQKDDELVFQCANKITNLLNQTFINHTFSHKKVLTFQEMADYNHNIDLLPLFVDRKIVPDGGVIWMDNCYPILITEAKRQGTNNERLKEGKNKQATGNAIERYGKNLMILQTMFDKDYILPAIAFCWGCDFAEGQTTVLSKLYGLNCFNPLNTKYFITKTGLKPHNIFYQEQPWKEKQIIDIMYELSTAYIKYYIEIKGGKVCI